MSAPKRLSFIWRIAWCKTLLLQLVPAHVLTCASFKEVPDLSRVDTDVCISCGSSYQGPKVSSVMCMCHHVRHPTKPVGNRVTAKLRFSKSGHPWQSSKSLCSETLRRNSSDLRKAHTSLAVLLSATVLRCGRQPGKLNGEHQNSTAICIRC